MTVALGASMGLEPFSNRSTIDSLSNVINAQSANATDDHSQSSHVWVSNGPLELDFDFGVQRQLTTFHFWNYEGEAFDVDEIDLTYFDGLKLEACWMSRPPWASIPTVPRIL